MADAQAVIQAIMQAAIESMKAVVQAMAAARAEVGARLRSEVVRTGPKLDGHSLKELSFHCNARDKCTELGNVGLR